MLSAGARPRPKAEHCFSAEGLFDATDFRAERMIIGMNKWR